jgi:hypothetical protein
MGTSNDHEPTTNTQQIPKMTNTKNLEIMSLVELGWLLIEAEDESVEQHDHTISEDMATKVSEEVIRRIGKDKVRPMMDYHYKAWADETLMISRGSRHLEFQVLMTTHNYINGFG